jgi:Resolvase, N terminal domain
LARSRYDDGGFSGGNMERQALQRLLADIRAGRIDIIVVYKVDRADPRWPILPGWSRSSTHRVSRSSR